ncbi:hypothetical protein GCM10010885_24660 [Alicyclobacillus cellulosilyticus]|uniref:Uncharacterized protein n=1 Tax=Alicyclobacillus cellulosilyticus TaxID=1003997 RepID=A0A917NNS7_9BACL|nr:hypothetical protein [Alicyclobacillus cellulosilyticus]GGJ14470.1 hypothetical protein GCM10010885_24660 [Alicyclobacillus cellulosilyticus]
MLEAKFQIKLTGPGLNFETDITPEKASHIVQICLSDTSFPSHILDKKTRQEVNKDNLSVAEYFNLFNPRRNPDKILCFASYIIDILGRESFEPEEIKPYFQKCGEPTPKNFSRDFRWAVSNGWLDESLNNPGQFYITSSGRKALESKFALDVIQKTKSPEFKARQKRRIKNEQNS